MSPGLDNLTINAGDSWAYLDPSVTVTSNTDDFREGYVEVDITNASAYDELHLVNGGSLSVTNGVVFYDGTRIGMIDSVYNGTNGRLRINFSATIPLINSGFETGTLAGWTVDYTHNQVQGQSWAIASDGWSACSAGSNVTRLHANGR